MTIAPSVSAEASKLAYQQNESLSEMVERLLREEMARAGTLQEWPQLVAEGAAKYSLPPSTPSAEEILAEATQADNTREADRRKELKRDASQEATGRRPSSKSS